MITSVCTAVTFPGALVVTPDRRRRAECGAGSWRTPVNIEGRPSSVSGHPTAVRQGGRPRPSLSTLIPVTDALTERLSVFSSVTGKNAYAPILIDASPTQA